MVFCNVGTINLENSSTMVTILILIDGFLQFDNIIYDFENGKCHNPYFNRWFSAIILVISERDNPKKVTILILIDGFLQYEVEFDYLEQILLSQSLF